MTHRWSKALIIKTIQDLRNQNVDLSSGYISKNYVSLYAAAVSRRYFNSWPNAVREAGFDYDHILAVAEFCRRIKLTKWSKTKVLEEIKNAYLLNLLKTYKERCDLYLAACREFGSWKEALKQAGFTLIKDPDGRSNQIFKSKSE